jgi:molybdopterin synthase catalytic subunit
MSTGPVVAIVATPIDVSRVMASVEHASVGAISVFVGTVREHNDGRAVTGIDYEAYQPMAERELLALAQETCAETAGLRLAVVHRVGSLTVGEASVVIAASHARRAPAMRAAQQVIEALKQRVPIWKREHYVDGDRRWVDPTAATTPAAP